MPFCGIGVTFILSDMGRKFSLYEVYALPVASQNQEIWNFHGSLTLNNGKLTGYFGGFFIPFCG